MALNPTNLTPRVERILQLARIAADSARVAFVNSEHLVLGILEDANIAAQTLAELYGKDVADLKRAFVAKMAPEAPKESPQQAAQQPPRYYLIHDNSVGWFTKLATVSADGSSLAFDIPNGLEAPYLDNLFGREPREKSIEHDGQSWTAWSISATEYQRVKGLIDLWPAVEKARKLGGAL